MKTKNCISILFGIILLAILSVQFVDGFSLLSSNDISVEMLDIDNEEDDMKEVDDKSIVYFHVPVNFPIITSEKTIRLKQNKRLTQVIHKIPSPPPELA